MRESRRVTRYLHTHRGPSVQYLLRVAGFPRRDNTGSVLVDSRGMDLLKDGPLVLWSEPLPPHTLENVGDGPIHAFVVELKERPTSTGS